MYLVLVVRLEEVMLEKLGFFALSIALVLYVILFVIFIRLLMNIANIVGCGISKILCKCLERLFPNK